MARPRAIAGAVAVLVILTVSVVVGYQLFTSDSGGDEADLSAQDGEIDGSSRGRQNGDTDRSRGGGGDGDDATGDTDGEDDGVDDSDGQDAPLDDGFLPPAWSLIATVSEDIPSFPEPGAESDGTVAAKWHGRQSALAVVQERPKWLRVRLAERPNGATTWVRRRDVEVSSTPFFVRIDVNTKRLQLWEQAELIMDAPVGIGTADAPTPTGSFFVTFLQEPPDDGANWGPFVMVTSGHSEEISDFQLSGDAITGIHGPLGAADRIGDGGAQVSKGCVRLHLDDLEQLRQVPAGSPIDIVDTSTGAGAST